jgi:hypothetical protein
MRMTLRESAAVQTDRPLDPFRRELLKLGVAGSLAFGVLGAGAALSGCSRREAASAAGYAFLRDADLAVMRALLPAILAGTLPADATQRVARVEEALHRLDGFGVALSQFSQEALRQLFDLLSFGPTRRFACGIAAPWSEVDVAQADAFLQRWRDSSVGLFNGGYRALVKLACVSHFTIAASIGVTGYPGPLKYVFDAANAP